MADSRGVVASDDDQWERRIRTRNRHAVQLRVAWHSHGDHVESSGLQGIDRVGEAAEPLALKCDTQRRAQVTQVVHRNTVR
ncbi:hypothetical protein D9M68_382190 [compost metagenome]